MKKNSKVDGNNNKTDDNTINEEMKDKTVIVADPANKVQQSTLSN